MFWGNRASIPAASNVMTYVFLNRTYGAYTDAQIFWSTGGQTKSIAQASTYDMPANSSGRRELQPRDLDRPVCRVHGAHNFRNGLETAIPHGSMRGPFLSSSACHCKDGYDAILGDQYHIFAMKRDSVFAMFKKLCSCGISIVCTKGAPYRIIAPGKGEGAF